MGTKRSLKGTYSQMALGHDVRGKDLGDTQGNGVFATQPWPPDEAMGNPWRFETTLSGVPWGTLTLGWSFTPET